MQTSIDLRPRLWNKPECAVFMKSRERHGNLSNMTFNFPITVNGVTFQGPEGLYQALKFPGHPQVQRQIAAPRSGMDAKKAAYAHPDKLRDDWDTIKLEAMTITLALKLKQHPETFGNALDLTQKLHIVECSYRDQWWGAKPQGQLQLQGVNALGQLLTKLRDLHSADPDTASERMLATANIEPFTINGKPLEF